MSRSKDAWHARQSQQSLVLNLLRRRHYLVQARAEHAAGDVVAAGRFIRWAVRTHYAAMRSRVWPDAWRGLGYAHSYRMRPRKLLQGVS
jgi:hypothetical protein